MGRGREGEGPREGEEERLGRDCPRQQPTDVEVSSEILYMLCTSDFGVTCTGFLTHALPTVATVMSRLLAFVCDHYR